MYFEHDLSFQLGCTVRELRRRVTTMELLEWVAYLEERSRREEESRQRMQATVETKKRRSR